LKFIYNKIVICITVFIGIFYLLIPLPNPLFEDDYSTVILDKDGKILRVFLNKKEQWHFPPNPELEIPQKLKSAVLHYEDRYFYKHLGVNPVSVIRALYQNITSASIVSGASTITMQAARIMKPKPRSYFNKMIEILQAFKIEIQYSKNDILKLYLDHAPYGGNITGYQAASLRYYQKFPRELTWGEAATLAVLPNAPGLVSPLSNPNALRRKRNRLLKSLCDESIINRETYQLACLEKIPDQSYPIPMYAPHLTQRLKDQYPNSAVIKTSIDKTLQMQIESLVNDHSVYLKTKGIQNAAALIVENQTGKVRAYIGSQDFFDAAGKGQVDGVRAPRSSGSILKPFLYALSMDEGLILPQTLIKDIPSFYKSFSPVNADEKYNGVVTAKEALTRSLNVPAVRLLNKYGIHSFYYFLIEAGISTLFRRADDYGLPLILGGAEVTLWDMAALYHGLADGGKFGPIRIIEDKKDSEKRTKHLISAGASYLSLNMLNELIRPGSEYYWRQYQNQYPLAWKTGTSYGHRDAWAVGVNPQWTIAVWVGNFSGQGNSNLAGSSCAGPLLFDIFNYLPKEPALCWFKCPENDLQKVKICLDTGFIAGDNCPQTVLTDAPLFMKPMTVCPYHKQIYVTLDEKEQVCSLCWEDGNYKGISRLVYPADVSQFLRQSGQIVESVPPHRASCPGQSDLHPLKIIYPQQYARLWVPRDFDGTLQKVNLRAAHQQKNRIIYWYIDECYKGSSKEKHTLAIELSKGWHKLEIIDESGNRNQIKFFVDLKN
jgi:penicillin-binding protein 1C